MNKDIILICALIWSLAYPIVANLNETMNSYRRVLIEKKKNHIQMKFMVNRNSFTLFSI